LDYSDLSIIIPTLNEEKSIGLLINELQNLYSNVSIVIADDGSKDRTKEIVSKFKNVFFLDRKDKDIKGLTVSVMDAINICKTQFFIVIDADFQHPPKKVGDIYIKLKQGNQIVIANRVKVSDEWPIHRKMISKSATFMGYLKLLPKNYFSYDILSGFFGAETNIAKKTISLHEKRFVKGGYKVLFDLLKILPKNRIAQIPYVFGSRKYGQSKLARKHMVFFIKSLLN